MKSGKQGEDKLVCRRGGSKRPGSTIYRVEVELRTLSRISHGGALPAWAGLAGAWPVGAIEAFGSGLDGASDWPAGLV